MVELVPCEALRKMETDIHLLSGVDQAARARATETRPPCETLSRSYGARTGNEPDPHQESGQSGHWLARSVTPTDTRCTAGVSAEKARKAYTGQPRSKEKANLAETERCSKDQTEAQGFAKGPQSRGFPSEITGVQSIPDKMEISSNLCNLFAIKWKPFHKMEFHIIGNVL